VQKIIGLMQGKCWRISAEVALHELSRLAATKKIDFSGGTG